MTGHTLASPTLTNLSFMLIILITLSLSGFIKTVFVEGQIETSLISKASGRQEESLMISQLLKEIAEEELQSCHAVLLTSTQMASTTLFLVQRELQLASQLFIAYDIASFSLGQPPDIPLLRHKASDSSVIYCIGYYLLASLQQVEEALATIPKSDWFSGATRYFVIYTGHSLNATDLEENPTILGAYNTLFISEDDSYSTIADGIWPVQLLSNCPFCRFGNPGIVTRDLWSPTKGFKRLSDNVLFPNLFRDCSGHVFRAVTLSFPPFMHYTEGNATHPIVLKDCLDRNIIRAISGFYNFSYELYEPADGQWGYQLSNGSHTGVLGVVQRYEADFSMDIAITAEREDVTDFTIGFHSEPLSFVTSKPQPLPQWLSMVRPYQLYVWICFIAAVVLAGPVYWILTIRQLSLTKSIFAMFASLLNQSCLWPKESSVRVYCGFWFIFSMVATVSYISNLTAFLTVPELSPTVDTLQDLSHSSFVWGINDYGAADYQLFKTSKVPLYQRIFRRLTFCPSLVQCVQQTLDQRFAFISWRTYLRDVIAMNFTDKNGYTPVHLCRESFFPGDIGYAMQKGSPMKVCPPPFLKVLYAGVEKRIVAYYNSYYFDALIGGEGGERGFNRILRRLIEGGFIEMWVTDLIQKHTLESQRIAMAESIARGEEDEEDEGTLTLTMHHLQGVFFIYGVGLLLSICLLLSEMVYHSCSGKERDS